MAIYKNALITGCGGDIACSISKISRSQGLFEKLIGCDIQKFHVGHAFFDVVELADRADSETFLETFEQIVKRNNIDIIVPTTDAELRMLSDMGFENELFGVPVVAASSEALKIGLDKLQTAQFIESTGLHTPWTVAAADSDPIEYPCIYKPRYGQGSKGFRIIHSKSELNGIHRTNEHILQEYLPSDDEEYTCGVYGSNGGDIRTITFRRNLLGGLTGSGITVNNNQINSLLHKIGQGINLNGSINVQLRLEKSVPMVFEINSRFSSTVAFRNKLGFRDFVWSLLERRGIQIEGWSGCRDGIHFYRTSEETILNL